MLLQVRTRILHAKSLQSCLSLCGPVDGSSPGSPVHRILQARILKWVAISFFKMRISSFQKMGDLEFQNSLLEITFQSFHCLLKAEKQLLLWLYVHKYALDRGLQDIHFRRLMMISLVVIKPKAMLPYYVSLKANKNGKYDMGGLVMGGKRRS